MASRDWPTERALNWTPRQREVLQLIAAGRTNAEIAEQLGVSLAGAKWHVSEVISKLGVRSREEAGAYWREANSVGARLGRGMAALLGLGTLKVAAGAAAAVAVVGVTVVGVGAMVGGGSGADGRVPVGDVASPTPEQGTPLPTPPSMYVPAEGSPRCSGDTSRNNGASIAVREVGGLELLLAGFRDGTDQLCIRLFGLPAEPPEATSWHGFAWPAESDDEPPSCSGTMPSGTGVIAALACHTPPSVAYAEVIVDGVSTQIAVDPLPAALDSTFKYLFTTFDGSAQSVQVRFFGETGNLVNETDIPWVTREDPTSFGPPPVMTEHITAVSPAHGETTRQADTPAGACAAARFEGLPGQGTWFHLHVDGEDVTGVAVWSLDLPLPPTGRQLCYAPAGGLEPGRHTVTVEVSDPQDPTAPVLETVTWSFRVAPDLPAPAPPAATHIAGGTFSRSEALTDGICLDGAFERFPRIDIEQERGTVAIRSYLDGEEWPGTLNVGYGSGAAQARVCLQPPLALEPGGHVLTIDVLDLEQGATLVDSITWAFEVVP